MVLRIISSVILIPPVIAAIWFGSPYFDGLVIIMGGVGIWEWCRICSNKRPNMTLYSCLIFFIAASISFILRIEIATYLILFAGVLVLAALGNFKKSGGNWPAIGFFYISVAIISLLWMRSGSADGRHLIVLFFVVVWATDIGAYAFGRTIGGPKLAPSISPNKTWAGLLGGMACAGIVAAMVVQLAPSAMTNIFPILVEQNQGMMMLAIAAAVLAVVAQGGDLFESWFKRRFSVKDSGNIIPGHGGVLDRVDGVLLGAPVCALIILLVQG